MLDDRDGDGRTARAPRADLVPGTQAAEIEVDDDTGTIEENEIYQSVVRRNLARRRSSAALPW